MDCYLFALDFDFALVALFLAAIFLFQVFHRRILDWAKGIDKRKGGRETFSEFIGWLKIRAVPKKAIFVSIAAIVLLDLVYYFAYGGTVGQMEFSQISTVVFHPVIEEFVYRGIFLGTLLFAVNSLTAKFKKLESAKYSLYAFAIVFQAIWFGFEHGALLQFWQGALFALLFFGHGRIGYRNNLLPPVIAHAVHNLWIALLNCYIFL